MVHITLISVGTLKEGYLRDAVAEYKKRLSQYARVEDIELTEERVHDESSDSEIRGALEREADKILAKVKSDSFKIALCIEGRQYSSEGLAALFERAGDERGKITLIIGSSHGLSERVKAACNERLSFSKMTFPHQLMRVMLFEALYRSYSIIGGGKYHK